MIDDPAIPDVPDIDSTKASNKELRKKIRILEARLETMGKHLGQLGPYMQDLMAAHFHVLQLAHKQQKALRLVVLGCGPAQLMKIKKTLEAVCGLVADGAAEYRKMLDPSLNTNHLVALQIKASEAKAAQEKSEQEKENENGAGAEILN